MATMIMITIAILALRFLIKLCFPNTPISTIDLLSSCREKDGLLGDLATMIRYVIRFQDDFSFF